MKAQIIILLFSTFIVFFSVGCKKKTTDPTKTTAEAKPDTSKVVPSVDSPKNEVKVPSVNLKGTWEGKTENKYKMTFIINNQTENSFDGTVAIHQKPTLRYNITGNFDIENNTLSFKDSESDKTSGNYTAVLTKDKKSLEGSKTYSSKSKKNSKVKFNLTKQP